MEWNHGTDRDQNTRKRRNDTYADLLHDVAGNEQGLANSTGLMEMRATTQPVVSAGHHGPGTANVDAIAY